MRERERGAFSRARGKVPCPDSGTPGRGAVWGGEGDLRSSSHWLNAALGPHNLFSQALCWPLELDRVVQCLIQMINFAATTLLVLAKIRTTTWQGVRLILNSEVKCLNQRKGVQITSQPNGERGAASSPREICRTCHQLVKPCHRSLAFKNSN